MKKGFTLVELLIVIGLLGAIALIVIAAINPIEQANRARDTKYRSDGGQLVSAIERYYATQQDFPFSTDPDLALPATSADDQLIGVCGATCAEDGTLITNNELKTEFRGRDFITKAATEPTDRLLILKDAFSSASVYACFVPKSNSEKQKACTNGKKAEITEGETTLMSYSDCPEDFEAADWESTWYVCIPE